MSLSVINSGQAALRSGGTRLGFGRGVAQRWLGKVFQHCMTCCIANCSLSPQNSVQQRRSGRQDMANFLLANALCAPNRNAAFFEAYLCPRTLDASFDPDPCPAPWDLSTPADLRTPVYLCPPPVDCRRVTPSTKNGPWSYSRQLDSLFHPISTSRG